MNLVSRPATRWLVSVTFALALFCAFAAWAQMGTDNKEPGSVVVSIYRIAPGKHVAFLKWMADREAAAREAGVPATQWYVHTDGDSWDYVAIAPESTAEQDDKVDAILKGKGMSTGFKGGLELRSLMASHTDTFARGPVTATELVEMAK
jgi:hypothetical protein